MTIVLFKSEPRQTPFAPEWQYILAETEITGVDFTKIKDIVLSKEKDIISKYQLNKSKVNIDGYTGLGPNSLTSRYDSYNCLLWEEEEIQKLKKQILINYIKFLKDVNVEREPTRIQCWANVMRKGDQIGKHLHSIDEWSYLSGNVTVACVESSTIYIDPINQINDSREYVSENKVGTISYFQQNIPHYTTKHMGDSERITLAFDIVVERQGEIPNNFIVFDDLSYNGDSK